MEPKMENEIFVVGQRVEKLCVVCGEERGHLISSLTKRGQVSRVSCAFCGTRSAFKRGVKTASRAAAQPGAPYDRTYLYHAGQTIIHPNFGVGEVMAVIEPQKIDVLFADRLRRMIHGRV